MATIEPSSLDRFLWERGIALAGRMSDVRGAVWGLGIPGVTNTLLGMAFLVVAAMNWGTSQGTGFLIAGPLTFLVGAGMLVGAVVLANRHRTRGPEVRLSADGARMLWRVLNHIGWVNPHHHHHMNQPNFITQLQSMGLFGGIRTASVVLRPDVFEILDAAAHQYNRISGVLKSKRPNAASPVLDRMQASIQAAAEETVISIINQAAILERVPESAEAIRKQIALDHRQLQELAERVENLSASTPTLTEQYASSSTMQSVLEQLRFDELAREELNLDPDPTQQRLET